MRYKKCKSTFNNKMNMNHIATWNETVILAILFLSLLRKIDVAHLKIINNI